MNIISNQGPRMDPNDFRYPCNGKQSELDVQSLANNPELLSDIWATAEGLDGSKFCSNRLLQVTKNLRDIDKKFQCFRELLQQDGKYWKFFIYWYVFCQFHLVHYLLLNKFI